MGFFVFCWVLVSNCGGWAGGIDGKGFDWAYGKGFASYFVP